MATAPALGLARPVPVRIDDPATVQLYALGVFLARTTAGPAAELFPHPFIGAFVRDMIAADYTMESVLDVLTGASAELVRRDPGVSVETEVSEFQRNRLRPRSFS